MDRLTLMEVFVRVVDCGSFSGAARQMRLSKSAVSRAVAELENRLGVRLFDRTTRTLSITEVGRAYHERAGRILAEVAEADLSASAYQAEPRGTLKIDGPFSFGILHLAPAIPEFLARYPHLHIDMTLNDRFVDVVAEGYDVVVRIGKLADSSLIARQIAPLRAIVCASPAYLEARGTPQRPEELAHHNCLGYSLMAMHEEWRFQEEGQPLAVAINCNFRVNNGDALRSAAVAGLGLAYLPSFIVGDDLRTGRLLRVLEPFTVKEGGIHAVYPHNRHLSPKVRAFVDFMAQRFGPRPYWEVEG